MRIAILGARGIPACYSGYDTLAEELSIGLVQAGGTDVVVYCRSGYYDTRPRSYHGVRLVHLGAPRIKGIESLVHSLLSSIHVLGQRADVVYFVDPANAPFCFLLRVCGQRVVIHTDGLGWKRAKWGYLARRYYKLVEWLASRTAHALVTDNPAMEDYYQREYGAASCYIPYGAETHHGYDAAVFTDLGLQEASYLLVVARLERENNTDLIIREFAHVTTALPLVIVGDAPYDAPYLRALRSTGDARVTFVGRLNDQAKLNALYRGAVAYIHGHEVGGTNPSLLRAMHAGTAPLVLDVPFNTHVVGDCGFTFGKRPGALAETLKRVLADRGATAEVARRARARASRLFRWDSVVEDHRRLFAGVAARASRT